MAGLSELPRSRVVRAAVVVGTGILLGTAIACSGLGRGNNDGTTRPDPGRSGYSCSNVNTQPILGTDGPTTRRASAPPMTVCVRRS